MRQTDHSDDHSPILNPEKLKQAMLFFLQSPGVVTLSATKLMRLLYFADFDFYEKSGKSITGARYRKRDRGPEPEGAIPLIAELERTGQVHRQVGVAEGLRQDLYAAHAQADLRSFSDAERTALEFAASRWVPVSDEQLDAAIQDEAPLLAVQANDVVPYYLAYYRNTYGAIRLDDEEMAHLAQAQQNKMKTKSSFDEGWSN